LAAKVESFLVDQASRLDPYPDYVAARAALGEVFQIPSGIWVSLSHEATQRLLCDSRVSRWEAAKDELGPPTGTDAEFDTALDVMLKMLMNHEEPSHTRLRRIIRQAFLPSAVEGWRQRIEALSALIVDRVLDRKEFDFLREIAYPLPESVMCDLLGVPLEDHALWSAWTRDNVAANRAAGIEGEALRRAQASAVHFYRYVKNLVAKRRANLGDDLVSVLIRAEAEGDKLTEQELIGTVIQLIQAGHDTTANLIGNAMVVLMRNPALYHDLTLHPERVSQAIDEVLRLESPTHFALARMTVGDIDHKGVHIPAGSRVVPILAAANRDPEVFAKPDKIDIDRPNLHKHLSFGIGIHICIGKQFALLEATTMLKEIVTRLPDLELIGEPAMAQDFLRVWQSVQVRRTSLS